MVLQVELIIFKQVMSSKIELHSEGAVNSSGFYSFFRSFVVEHHENTSVDEDSALYDEMNDLDPTAGL